MKTTRPVLDGRVVKALEMHGYVGAITPLRYPPLITVGRVMSGHIRRSVGN